MSQNIVDKVVKNILPVGSILTFNNSTNPNELYEGNWNKLGTYTNLIFFNSIELAKDISGTTHKNRTYLLGSYYDRCAWLTNDFVAHCPDSYYLVARLNLYGYTGSDNTITVYLNNKSVSLLSWGPSSYTSVNTTSWWAQSTLLPDDTTYGINNSNKGINLSYEVTIPDASWCINSIILDLGYMPYNSKNEWIRVS